MAQYKRQWTATRTGTDDPSLTIALPPLPAFSAEWQMSLISGFCDTDSPMSVGLYLDADPNPFFEVLAIRFLVLPFPEGLYCGVGRAVSITIAGTAGNPPPGTDINLAAVGNLHAPGDVQIDGPASGFLFRVPEVLP